MPKYNLYKPNWRTTTVLDNDDAAANLAASLECAWGQAVEGAVEPMAIEGLMPGRIKFGQQLIQQFIVDNLRLGIVLSPSASLQMLAQFQNAKSMLEIGALDNARVLIRAIPVSDYFSADRRNGYVTAVTEYINSEPPSI